MAIRVHRLFIPQVLKIGLEVKLDSAQSHYLKRVLRAESGHIVVLFNGQAELNYPAKILELGKLISLKVVDQISTELESKLNIHLILALSKNEHLDYSLQKCTELGVTQFDLFNSERTQSHLKQKQIEKKMTHWNGVIQSACEQCGRSKTPLIFFHPNLDKALSPISDKSKGLVLDFAGENFKAIISSITGENIHILLGAEGGLTETEIKLAEQNNYQKVTLGPRVLRTETAASSAVTALGILLGDM